MIKRTLETFIRRYSPEYPVIALVGPRQSGKTTLVRHLFPEHKYLSLENLDLRHMAEDDPRGFLDDHGKNLILDEIQRVPSLFSYLQEKVDQVDTGPGCYVLTGSKQFLLMEKITQLPAGRIITFNLYPFTINELYPAKPDTDIDSIFSIKTDYINEGGTIDIFQTLFTGMYPRIYDKNLDPGKWIENYILTYVERDIRTLVNVENLKIFENFIISEFYKRLHHISEKPPLYFWRDKTGNEIDLVVEKGTALLPIEIKSSKTYHPAMASNISAWFTLKGNTARKGFIVYRGDQVVGKKSDVTSAPWWFL